jgi:hypothetical protein
MKRERDPTPEEFEKFLAWLDPDPDEAGRKFERIQTRLIQIFIARGCVDAEVLADEVLNRVCVRIDQVKLNYSDPLRCCVGFVDNVHREYLREQRKRDEAVAPPLLRSAVELEIEDTCLDECLDQLPKLDRELVERYFQGEKSVKIAGRKKLAVERMLTSNALRIQAFKLRKKFISCFNTCIERAEAETISG